MHRTGCAREDELLDALQSSRWPDACGAELRHHAVSCASCTDLLSVVAPLLDEHRALVASRMIPTCTESRIRPKGAPTLRPGAAIWAMGVASRNRRPGGLSKYASSSSFEPRFFLDPPGIGQHDTAVGHQVEELQVAERLEQADPSAADESLHDS